MHAVEYRVGLGAHMVWRRKTIGAPHCRRGKTSREGIPLLCVRVRVVYTSWSCGAHHGALVRSDGKACGLRFACPKCAGHLAST